MLGWLKKMLQLHSRNVASRKLYRAASEGNTRIVKELLAKDVEVNWKGFFERMPLMDVLLKASKNILPDWKGFSGRTPLMEAAMQGSQELCDMLLKAEARRDLKDKSGATAFDYACYQGHFKLAQLLAITDFNLNDVRQLTVKAILPSIQYWEDYLNDELRKLKAKSPIIDKEEFRRFDTSARNFQAVLARILTESRRLYPKYEMLRRFKIVELSRLEHVYAGGAGRSNDPIVSMTLQAAPFLICEKNMKNVIKMAQDVKSVFQSALDNA